MISHAVSYHRHRFPAEIISHAVWLYHRFCLSFRDTEDLLAQRGITVSYETIRKRGIERAVEVVTAELQEALEASERQDGRPGGHYLGQYRRGHPIRSMGGASDG